MFISCHHFHTNQNHKYHTYKFIHINCQQPIYQSFTTNASSSPTSLSQQLLVALLLVFHNHCQQLSYQSFNDIASNNASRTLPTYQSFNIARRTLPTYKSFNIARRTLPTYKSFNNIASRTLPTYQSFHIINYASSSPTSLSTLSIMLVAPLLVFYKQFHTYIYSPQIWQQGSSTRSKHNLFKT